MLERPTAAARPVKAGLSPRSLRAWQAVHTWSSLICTAFMLLLCVTGLPLIFHHEIEELMGEAVSPPALPAGTPNADLDRVITAGKAFLPGEIIRYVVFDKEEPDVAHLILAPSPEAPDTLNRVVVVDRRTAQVLGGPMDGDTLVGVLFRLHTDMFAGLPGKLFLGGMGLLLVAALVSGVVLYAPFMKRLDFGTVRKDRSARLKWLDLHNLIGIVTLAWVAVVGLTGVLNTWADLVLMVWQRDQLAEMIAPYQGVPPLAELGPVQKAVDVAQTAAPHMEPAFVAFPGTPFTSPHHYAVFMRGDTTLTSRLVKPVLVDAASGALTDMRDLPWYVAALLISQPLHFGDYGGMPLKIIWAILDIASVIVLASGLYLWIARRRGARGRRS